MLKVSPLGSRDFVLVDLRRNDFEVSSVCRGSVANKSWGRQQF
jgi:hypothetical protein